MPLRTWRIAETKRRKKSLVFKNKYLKNYDLEKGGDDDDAPLSKQFVFGINVTF